MIDYHIHSSISADCKVSMQDMARAAVKAGLKEICLTEHIDLNLTEGPDFSVDFDAYTEAIEKTRAMFPELKIRMGIEAGLDIASAPQMKELIKDRPLDFVVGSQHVVFGLDPFYETVWKLYDKNEIFAQYLKTAAESVKALDDYDVMGHIGYISKFCPYDDKLLRYADYTDAVDALLKALISKGKGIEVNTNGLYMTPSTMPETAIIRRYFELGGEIVTVGSDAHYETVVGHAVSDTLNTLKSIGFRYICAFKRRCPVFLPL